MLVTLQTTLLRNTNRDKITPCLSETQTRRTKRLEVRGKVLKKLDQSAPSYSIASASASKKPDLSNWIRAMTRGVFVQPAAENR